MAYGKQSGNFNGRHINAKYTSKEGTSFLELPYFKLSEKQGSEYKILTKEQLKELTGKETHPFEVSGDLIDLSVREGEYENSPVRSFKATLQDGSVRNYVEFGLGSINGRSVANALLSLKAFTDVQFSSWNSFDKTRNKNFSKVSVRQGEGTETVKWKYDPKAPDSKLPAAREFQGKGGKLEKDYTEQEIFLFSALNEFAKTVKNIAPAQSSAPAAESAPKAAAPAAQENLDEDVPF